MFSILNMGSLAEEGDLTARAAIRNAALRLFAERGADAVTVREIASTAGVSAALVVHHFGSKEGLRVAVDAYAGNAFDKVLEDLDGDDLSTILTSGNSTSIAEAFTRAFPHGSALPAYLRRLLLTNDPAGAALFGRWFAATQKLMDSMVDAGLAAPSADPAVRAAFLLANDLALILLRNQIAGAIGVDPLTQAGITRWASEVTEVYTHGAYADPREQAL